ncbi:hypothetical protein [Geoglobus acetivorans]|uniref:Uncharacterized protein n=1 Tax=Geoglobus acetivorans TaxID=565033 RepID=A0A0A7GBB2_GEOAI|nr:hypothetical protein GACE_0253 [Geoglobus acetivorans]
MSYRLVEIEEDLQYINVASRKNDVEHALIRLVLSTLADVEEIQNLTKRDISASSRNGREIYAVYLRKPGKSRKVPVDGGTYTILRNISASLGGKDRVFSYSTEEIDSIIGKYSPENSRYTLHSLREALMELLADNLLGKTIGDIFEMDFEELVEFMEECHPMFSGMWDIDEDDVASDYFHMLAERHGMSVSKMSEVSGEDEERIEKLIGRKWLQSYWDSYSE